ncbi:SDR family NAD(P)-dependent oxidoreductase [Leifsonia sp. 21MFCrub1.1]|uniref:SDR family NAD(P)-dependent oxidoreductase n=1 Tax=Leifsonia sp. 21MFCrub1.1 TaxID=1798223 RepID=UPI0008927FB4|nr:SDR family NAD(P)-dependent oxidoreductase [Leifsonia sp. 21MFCrub1.1]SEA50969.1 NADP-dependent 3-hydroxy acid dehydrogenase YdfG [Leifsonia sp. 21MFCrub1.1]
MRIDEGRFDGARVIVTGAGSGIGRATALRLLAEGATVIGTDISESRLSALAEEAATERLIAVAGDVSDESVVGRVVQAADGTVTSLANIAGIMDDFLPPAEVEDEVWDRVLRVNLTAVMRLTRAVLPAMVERGAGTIVNVSSEAGLRGSAAGAAYTASKHAVIGLTRSTAFFYAGKGVRCNAVAPGATITNIQAEFRSAFAGERMAPYMQTNVPQPATADELAAAIAWLLSDDSANVNGAVLPSDNGWSVI